MQVLKEDNLKINFSAYRLLYYLVKATIGLTIAVLSIPADFVYIGKLHPMNSIAGLISRFLKRQVVILDCDDYETAFGHFQYTWRRKFDQFFVNRAPHWVNHITVNTYF